MNGLELDREIYIDVLKTKITDLDENNTILNALLIQYKNTINEQTKIIEELKGKAEKKTKNIDKE